MIKRLCILLIVIASVAKGQCPITVNSATICTGNAVTLTASGATTYSWIPSNTLSSSTGASVVANPTITTSYTIIGTAGTCTSITTATVTVITPTTCSVSASSNSIIYAGSTIVLSAAMVTSGTNCPITGATTYTWSGPNSYTATAQNPTINFCSLPMAGVYTVELTVGGISCVATTTVVVDTLTVTIFPPDSSNHNFIYCTNVPYHFTGNANPGPISFYEWECTPSVNFNPNPPYQNGENITFPSPGTYTIGLYSNSLYAGVDSTKYVVHVVQTPTITVSPVNPFICNGGTGINIYVHGAQTYTWSNASTTVPPTSLDVNADSVNINPSTLTPPTAFVYSVSGTAADGCVSASVVDTVTVIPIPTPYFYVNPDTICAGMQTVLCVDSMPIITTYTWSAPPQAGLGVYSANCPTAIPVYSGRNDTTFIYQVLINVPSCPPYPPHDVSVHVLDSSSCTYAGIVSFSSNNAISVYPNPATTSLQVSLAGNSANATLVITDMLGNAVKQLAVNSNQLSISVSELNEGIYNISISNKEGTINKRVVIVK